jgi:hypothetical protein
VFLVLIMDVLGLVLFFFSIGNRFCGWSSAGAGSESLKLSQSRSQSQRFSLSLSPRDTDTRFTIRDA